MELDATALEAQLRSVVAGLSQLPMVGDVRVIGGVAALELVSDRTTRSAAGYLDDIGPHLAAAFIERGLLLRPLGNILYFMPPFVITESETAWALDQIAEVLTAAAAANLRR